MDGVLTQLDASHNLKANEWVVSWLRRLPVRSKVLDFASGQGRHALAAFSLGMEVEAWDKDALALEALRQIAAHRVHCVACDLESQPWPHCASKFDAVVVTNYLFRPRLAMLAELLNQGGVLVYQTFAVGHETLGRPRRPDFLLKPGELFEAALGMGLHVLSYEDSVCIDEAPECFSNRQYRVSPAPSSRVQRLVALKAEGGLASPEALSAWPVNIHG
jgi:SAM-dependent methyltransferase